MKKNIFLLFILLLSCNKADSQDIEKAQSIEKTQDIKKPDELKQEKLASEWWGESPLENMYLTPLAAAASSFNEAETMRLLDLGADPNYRDKMPVSTIGAVLLSGEDDSITQQKQYEIIKLLLNAGADPDQTSSSMADSSPLLLASGGVEGEPNIKVVQLLLEHGADPDLARSDNGLTLNSDGMAPLQFAAGGGQQPANLELTKLLLENGADPNLGRSDNGKTLNSDGMATLQFAAGGGQQPANLELTKLLLENEADPNLARSDNGLTPASDGATPLIFAVGGAPKPANLELGKLLLEYGADPNLGGSDNGKTPYSDGANPLELNITMQAQSNGSTEIADFLLEKGAILNDRFIFGGSTSTTGHSLLSFVVSQDSLMWARWLLEHKVNPNISTEHGSPLEIAQNQGNTEMVALLEEFGAK